MTPNDALQALTLQGVSVSLVGDDLDIDTPDGFITAEWLEWFRLAKPGLVARLRWQPQRPTFFELHDGLSEADRYALDERAAVYEFEAGFTRNEAEVMAANEWP